MHMVVTHAFISLAEVSICTRGIFFLSRDPDTYVLPPDASANSDEVRAFSFQSSSDCFPNWFALDCWRSGDLIEIDVCASGLEDLSHQSEDLSHQPEDLFHQSKKMDCTSS